MKEEIHPTGDPEKCPENYGAKAFSHLFGRGKGAPISKPQRVKDKDLLRMARGMACANPNCPHQDARCHAYFRLADPHHVTKRSQGGGDTKENLCPLCRTCHVRAENHEFTEAQLREWSAAAWAKEGAR